MAFTSYDVDADKSLERAIKKYSEEVNDFTFSLTETARVIKKFQTAHFTLKGSGQYEELSEEYAEFKEDIVGIQPILVFNKRLKKAVIGRTQDSVLEIGKKSLVVGEDTGYGIFHQSDEPRSIIPLRKFLFITDDIVEQIIKIMEAEKLSQAEDAGFEVK